MRRSLTQPTRAGGGRLVFGCFTHARVGISLDIYSHVLPGMQAAEKFDRLFDDGDANAIPEGSVGKPSANPEGITSRPCGIRTHDTLIKRFKRYVPKSGGT